MSFHESFSGHSVVFEFDNDALLRNTTAAGGIGAGDKTQSEYDRNTDDGIASLDGLISKSSSVSSSPGSEKNGHYPDQEGDETNVHLQQGKEQENVEVVDPTPVIEAAQTEEIKDTLEASMTDASENDLVLIATLPVEEEIVVPPVTVTSEEMNTSVDDTDLVTKYREAAEVLKDKNDDVGELLRSRDQAKEESWVCGVPMVI